MIINYKYGRVCVSSRGFDGTTARPLPRSRTAVDKDKKIEPDQKKTCGILSTAGMARREGYKHKWHDMERKCCVPGYHVYRRVKFTFCL